jgi:hypothetical protein
VRKVAIAGGTAVTIASGQSTPWGIAVDQNFVYFTTHAAAGSVLKVAK